ncbi:MAG: MATE family efflux transporter, partial [Rhodococcus fascians]
MNTSTASTENVTETEGSNRWYLSSAPIFRALVHLCIPMAAALIVTAVYNVVNAGFIGSLHDATLLAAVTLGSPVLGIVMAVGGVFGTGGSALISRLLGGSEADPSKAGEIKHVASFSVWGAAAVGGVIGAAGVVFVDPLVAMLGARSNEVHATTAFVVVLLVFVPVLTTSFCLEQLVRAEGATRQVMTGLILSTVANVV